VGVRISTIGKVLIGMAILMFVAASLARGGAQCDTGYGVNAALAPACKFLCHMKPPVCDAAAFSYLCALTLGATGSAMTIAGFFLRHRKAAKKSSGQA
jgi:hypothetical protein